MTLLRHALGGTPVLCLRRLCLGALLASSVAAADTGSNLPGSAYPAMGCTKPVRPFTPLTMNSSAEMLQYKLVVERYNTQLREFGDCVNAYLAAAQADVQRIQTEMNRAVAVANAP